MAQQTVAYDSNGSDLAKSIGERLANDSIAVLSMEPKDLLDNLIITMKFQLLKIPEGLEIMRHTLTAQVLASAIKNYPKAQLAIKLPL